ncbi:immunogenic protein [Hoeflea sp. BAL378]|uniref:TAXI family TRAP transporter solute-binding subunit n=1 Tax=Hoeflea sp. BAL378 TaxID=1547437 RepID=UPI00051365C1|nr:TAXI family TRAP transporter solute-binding subunit [Hoeflea sp. BAL378]KGF70110.1 immunogenic protein [Hoeflea sp. BAL378]
MRLLTATLARAAQAAAVGAALIVGASGLQAQEMNFFSIGTGGTGGTYFPLGGAIANAISNPPGSRACDEGGSCGVPGLVAIAQSSRGSVANVNGIKSGILSSGFSQSDVAYWAYSGTGTFEGQEPMQELRAIAALYPEHIHLVASKESGITSVADLKGKRVSLDEPGSGTYVDAQLILKAFGLTEEDITVENLKPGPASDAIRNGQLDALFFVGGYPTGTLVELASSAEVVLVPISGPEVDAMIEEYSFFSKDPIPDGVYQGVAGAETVAVGAQWLTSANQKDDLIYEITKALWNDSTRALLDAGHAKGKTVTKETALDGIGIPLHPGAEKFYREAGLIK